VRNALMVTLSGVTKVDSVLDCTAETRSGQPMPAEWRNILVRCSPMDRAETAALKAGEPDSHRRHELGISYLVSSDGATEGPHERRGERDVVFDGATARLRGRLRPPMGAAWGALVLSHGRSETWGVVWRRSRGTPPTWGCGVSASISRSRTRARSLRRPRGRDRGSPEAWLTRGRRRDSIPSSSRDEASAHGLGGRGDGRALCRSDPPGLSYTGQPETAGWRSSASRNRGPDLGSGRLESDRRTCSLARPARPMTSVNLEISAGPTTDSRTPGAESCPKRLMKVESVAFHLRKAKRGA